MEKKNFIEEKLPKIRRKCFDTLHAYTPGEQPQDIEQWIKLNTNENPYSPPQSVISTLTEALNMKLRMYPDPTAKDLRKAIIKNYIRSFPFKTLDSIDNITVANGSDETLDLLFKTFIDKGDCVLYCTPSYGMYPVLAETYDATKVVIPLNKNDFSIPIEKIQFKEKDKLLIICSPNNPNGGVVPLEKIRMICNKFPGIVFIDEAYGDFANQTALEILPEYPNLIIGKTFSKSFGMASIRLGFAIAHHEIIKLFNTIRLPYNVTYLTQMAGIAALDSWNEIIENINKIKSERERMINQLKQNGYNILPTQSNFFLIKFENSEKCNNIFNKLKAQKILTRYWSTEQLKIYLRVTVGTPQQNDTFLKAMELFSKE